MGIWADLTYVWIAGLFAAGIIGAIVDHHRRPARNERIREDMRRRGIEARRCAHQRRLAQLRADGITDDSWKELDRRYHES